MLTAISDTIRPMAATAPMPGLHGREADLAEELAVDRPLVIGLDDLQWADQSSLLTLAALGRRLAGLPAALIACFRPSPRPRSWDPARNSPPR